MLNHVQFAMELCDQPHLRGARQRGQIGSVQLAQNTGRFGFNATAYSKSCGALGDIHGSEHARPVADFIEEVLKS
ncbi:hypothetical protein, partial [Xanthomonas oryzae]